MRPIQLYIATSLDGYIARPDGGLDWLENFPNPDQLDYGYADFYAAVDTIVLGRSTYEEVLRFGIDWPYADATTYVVTRQADYAVSTPHTSVLTTPLGKALDVLQQTQGGNIWLVGGGQLASTALSEGLVDELWLTLIPTVLGEGIPLWEKGVLETTFELVEALSFDTGVVQLRYGHPITTRPK